MVPGSVAAVVGVTLLAPPAASCGKVSVSASNDGGFSEGAAVEYTYAASLGDLNAGLVGYWSFDVHAKGAAAGLVTFPDQVGGNHLSYHAEVRCVESIMSARSGSWRETAWGKGLRQGLG